MDDASPRPFPGPGARWALWLLAVSLWTAALLRPEPSAVEDAALPAALHPLASKTLHVTAYAGLVLLSAWQLTSRRVRTGLVLFLVGHAMATEYLQQFVPPRVSSWIDVGFNLFGIGVGLIAIELVRQRAGAATEPSPVPRPSPCPEVRS